MVPQRENVSSTQHPVAGSTGAHGNAGDGTKKGIRTLKRSLVVAIAAALVTLLGGAAFAVNYLMTMGPNDAEFFDGNNLPVFDSMQAGTASLSADVGQAQTVGDMTLTLDTISCDRSIINLFFTVEKEDGFDLESLSVYEGSQENEWPRLQRLIPFFRYSITSAGQDIDEGSTRQLDAYLEGDKVKCMLRITPVVSLPEQVEVHLKHGFMSLASIEAETTAMDFTVGLDLSTVDRPQDLGTQDIVFHTSQGDKSLSIKRFTVSEFGTVFVADNPSTWSDDGRSFGVPDGAIHPYSLKITDGQGTVLSYVDAGDGMGNDLSAPFILELAGSPTTDQGLTFTPMLIADDGQAQENILTFDASQIGAKLPTSEFGGYELVQRDVGDRTVSLTLRPYGWLAGGTYFEAIPDDEAITLLWTENQDPETGETFLGGHSGIQYTKRDYAMGDLIQMNSYYAASDEELKALVTYQYLGSFGMYHEDTDAAVSLMFES